jgi:nifR3 family TIM-barrel protein
MNPGGENLCNEALRIGPLAITARAFLAPMSGVTDIGMRRIAQRCGAGLVFSEMVASDCYVKGENEARLRAEGDGVEIHVVQLAGRDPLWMSEAARLAEANGAAIIDINMGCPAKKVTGGYGGSALMRDLDLALRLIEATVAAVAIPVTLKTRLGWDRAALNAPQLARKAEEAGIQMVTIHGRTRCDFYKGTADWNAIRAIKDAVSIPVVANGDCAGEDDARALLQAAGADAVMIGRAAVGRPWLVGAVARQLAGEKAITLKSDERREMALEHYDSLLSQFGVVAGTRHARKHIAGYLAHGARQARESDRLALLTSEDPRLVTKLLASLLNDAPALAA